MAHGSLVVNAIAEMISARVSFGMEILFQLQRNVRYFMANTCFRVNDAMQRNMRK